MPSLSLYRSLSVMSGIMSYFLLYVTHVISVHSWCTNIHIFISGFLVVTTTRTPSSKSWSTLPGNSQNLRRHTAVMGTAYYKQFSPLWVATSSMDLAPTYARTRTLLYMTSCLQNARPSATVRRLLGAKTKWKSKSSRGRKISDLTSWKKN